MSKTYEQLEPVISALDERIKTNFSAFPTDTAEGEIASFSDGADAPMKSLIVGIEPVQDLHGYDNPWPAGGGKNLCSVNEMTVTGYSSQSIVEIPAGSYTLSMNLTSTDTDATTCFVRFLNSIDAPIASIQMDRGTGVTKQIVFGESVVKIMIFASSNANNSSGDTATATNIQIESGTNATAFEPYANICPITGWTGAKISKSGINLWDEEWVVGTVSNVGVPYYLEGKIRSKNYIPVKQGTTLYFKCPSELRVAQYDASKTFISYTAVTNGTLTMTDKTCFVMFAMDKADETYDGDISINYPATDTVYHPYAGGESLDITFPTEAGTVYGGSLDVTNGVLTVDKVIADMGTLNWTYVSAKQRIVAQVNSAKPYGANLGFDGACSVYKVVTDVGYRYAPDKSIIIGNNFISNAYAAMVVFDSAYTDAETFKTAVSGQTLVFPVKNPIVYQLTPTEVKSLLGQNNIWADAGDTTAEYRADTSAYIAKKIAEAISALS